MILGQEDIKKVNIDGLALRVLLKVFDILGGPRALFEYRNLTWVPSIIEASYAIILAQEMNKTEDEIAEFLGATKQTVRNMLRADPELVKKRLNEELQEKTLKAHIAGGLAKWAYEEIKKGNENIPFLAELLEEAIEAIGVEWPVRVLQRIRGVKFPVSRDEIIERLKGLKIYGQDVKELLEGESFESVRRPSDLLHIIKVALQKKGAIKEKEAG